MVDREGCCAQYRKPCTYHEGREDERDVADAEIAQLRHAMSAAVPLINAAGDSTLERLWREAGYDTPRKRQPA